MKKFWDRSTGSKLAELAAITLAFALKFLLYRHLTELDNGLTTRQSALSIIVNIGAAAVLASIIITRRHIWSAALLAITLDVWLIGNTIYFYANHLLPDWQTLTLVSQLRGFESSIVTFLDWKLTLFPFLTLTSLMFLYALRQHQNDFENTWKIAATSLLMGIAMQTIGTIANNMHGTDEDKWSIRDDENNFLRAHSPLGHIAYAVKNAVTEGILNIKANTPLTPHELNTIRAVTRQHSNPSEPQGHLAFILVESLETWALDATDINGNSVCPNLQNYICSNDVLYCPRVITQQQYGRSGDGQLITQTGLLPLKHGVACMQYGDNTYPNLAHFFDNSVIITGYPGVWNQHTTTQSYGFKHLREPRFGAKSSDKVVLQQMRQELENSNKPTCALALTIDTHAPFKTQKQTPQFGQGLYSAAETSYLRCVNSLDSLLGNLLAWADTAATMSTATIVITADHNHFPVGNGRGVCPLIIRSPKIKQRIIINEAYQMDIFPTVLNIIGQANYFWQGFGSSLVATTNDDEITRHDIGERLVSPNEALDISDKLIRSNFFSNSKQ